MQSGLDSPSALNLICDLAGLDIPSAMVVAGAVGKVQVVQW